MVMMWWKSVCYDEFVFYDIILEMKLWNWFRLKSVDQREKQVQMVYEFVWNNWETTFFHFWVYVFMSQNF